MPKRLGLTLKLGLHEREAPPALIIRDLKPSSSPTVPIVDEAQEKGKMTCNLLATF